MTEDEYKKAIAGSTQPGAAIPSGPNDANASSSLIGEIGAKEKAIGTRAMGRVTDLAKGGDTPPASLGEQFVHSATMPARAAMAGVGLVGDMIDALAAPVGPTFKAMGRVTGGEGSSTETFGDAVGTLAEEATKFWAVPAAAGRLIERATGIHEIPVPDAFKKILPDAIQRKIWGQPTLKVMQSAAKTLGPTTGGVEGAGETFLKGYWAQSKLRRFVYGEQYQQVFEPIKDATTSVSAAREAADAVRAEISALGGSELSTTGRAATGATAVGTRLGGAPRAVQGKGGEIITRLEAIDKLPQDAKIAELLGLEQSISAQIIKSQSAGRDNEARLLGSLQEGVRTSLNDGLEKINPQLKPLLEKAKSDWKENVAEFYTHGKFPRELSYENAAMVVKRAILSPEAKRDPKLVAQLKNALSDVTGPKVSAMGGEKGKQAAELAAEAKKYEQSWPMIQRATFEELLRSSTSSTGQFGAKEAETFLNKWHEMSPSVQQLLLGDEKYNKLKPILGEIADAGGSKVKGELQSRVEHEHDSTLSKLARFKPVWAVGAAGGAMMITGTVPQHAVAYLLGSYGAAKTARFLLSDEGIRLMTEAPTNVRTKEFTQWSLAINQLVRSFPDFETEARASTGLDETDVRQRQSMKRVGGEIRP